MLTVMLLAAMEKALLLMTVVFGLIAAIGFYDGWANKRGVLGWIVSLMTVLVGGVVTMALSVAIGDAMITRWPRSPVGEMVTMASPIMMLLGAWLALLVVNRFR